MPALSSISLSTGITSPIRMFLTVSYTHLSKLDDVENVSISFMTTKMVLKADEDKMDAVIAESEKIIKKIEPDVVMKPKA